MALLTGERIDHLRRACTPQSVPAPLFGYATVQDYCASLDDAPELAARQGDLKDVQRPWALRTLAAHVPPGGRLIEIGAGEPLVAQALADLGYAVTVVDPYDGSGLGPTAFEHYAAAHPDLTMVRAQFGPGVLPARDVDAVYSISVLEHVPEAGLAAIFAGIDEVLAPGGLSLHCYDCIVEGDGEAYNRAMLEVVAEEQVRLAGIDPLRGAAAYARALDDVAHDLDAYYLSASGHALWKGPTPYAAFPYRRVASFTTAARRAAV